MLQIFMTDLCFNSTDNEVLIGVFGRAGYQNYYKRKLVNSIGFIIFNKSTLAVRTAGVNILKTLGMYSSMLTCQFAPL